MDDYARRMGSTLPTADANADSDTAADNKAAAGGSGRPTAR
jgi:hypothetical protein